MILTFINFSIQLRLCGFSMFFYFYSSFIWLRTMVSIHGEGHGIPFLLSLFNDGDCQCFKLYSQLTFSILTIAYFPWRKSARWLRQSILQCFVQSHEGIVWKLQFEQYRVFVFLNHHFLNALWLQILQPL